MLGASTPAAASVAADAVLIVHAAFVVWVAVGGAFVAWRPRLAWLHLPALAWGVWIIGSHGICPLTPLENALRLTAGEGGYEGGFIERYVAALIYPKGLTPQIQTWIASVLAAGNLVLYGAVVVRARARRREIR